MTIASRLENYLEDHNTDYDIVHHPYSECSLDTAHNACIPSRVLAKAVVLEDDGGRLMAVMPASNRLILSWLNQALDRKLQLISEQALENLFPDCQPGAIPAIGEPWGITTTCDARLKTLTDLYFEAGSHRELIHMHRDQYQALITNNTQRTNISCPACALDLLKS